MEVSYNNSYRTVAQLRAASFLIKKFFNVQIHAQY